MKNNVGKNTLETWFLIKSFFQSKLKLHFQFSEYFCAF